MGHGLLVGTGLLQWGREAITQENGQLGREGHETGIALSLSKLDSFFFLLFFFQGKEPSRFVSGVFCLLVQMLQFYTLRHVFCQTAPPVCVALQTFFFYAL